MDNILQPFCKLSPKSNEYGIYCLFWIINFKNADCENKMSYPFSFFLRVAEDSLALSP